MKITVLAENTTYGDLRCEHGLSLYIETGAQKLLFDMGQTDLFAENAGKLGIDLSHVDIAVLSHGHYDHGGGIKKFLSINSKAPVYMSRFAFEEHFNASDKYIGLDPELKSEGRIMLTDGITRIAWNMTIISCNEREKPAKSDSAGLKMKSGNDLVPEDFRHEHYLLIEENGKRILLSGCSHKGIINIEDWFRPDYLIGGFHLSKMKTDEALAGISKRLSSYSTKYYTCHCTGVEQYEFMKQYMSSLMYLSTGMTIEI